MLCSHQKHALAFDIQWLILCHLCDLTLFPLAFLSADHLDAQLPYALQQKAAVCAVPVLACASSTIFLLVRCIGCIGCMNDMTADVFPADGLASTGKQRYINSNSAAKLTTQRQ